MRSLIFASLVLLSLPSEADEKKITEEIRDAALQTQACIEESYRLMFANYPEWRHRYGNTHLLQQVCDQPLVIVLSKVEMY